MLNTLYPYRVCVKLLNIDKSSSLKRLNRIEGQVRGISRMIEEERYCIEVLQQLQAVKAALARVEDVILQDHAASCVSDAIASGDEKEQRKKFEELVGLFSKIKR